MAKAARPESAKWDLGGRPSRIPGGISEDQPPALIERAAGCLGCPGGRWGEARVGGGMALSGPRADLPVLPRLATYTHSSPAGQTQTTQPPSPPFRLRRPTTSALTPKVCFLPNCFPGHSCVEEKRQQYVKGVQKPRKWEHTSAPGSEQLSNVQILLVQTVQKAERECRGQVRKAAT